MTRNSKINNLHQIARWIPSTMIHLIELPSYRWNLSCHDPREN